MLSTFRKVAEAVSPYPIAVFEISKKRVIYVNDSHYVHVENPASTDVANSRTQSSPSVDPQGFAGQLAALRQPSQTVSTAITINGITQPRNGTTRNPERPLTNTPDQLSTLPPSVKRATGVVASSPDPSPQPGSDQMQGSFPFIGLLILEDQSGVQQKVQMEFELDIKAFSQGNGHRSQTQTNLTNFSLSLSDAETVGDKIISGRMPHIRTSELSLEMTAQPRSGKHILSSQQPQPDFTDIKVSASNEVNYGGTLVASATPAVHIDYAKKFGNTTESTPFSRAFKRVHIGKGGGLFYWKYTFAHPSAYSNHILLPPHSSIVHYFASSPITSMCILAEAHLELKPMGFLQRWQLDRSNIKPLNIGKYKTVLMSLNVLVQKNGRQNYIQFEKQDDKELVAILHHKIQEFPGVGVEITQNEEVSATLQSAGKS